MVCELRIEFTFFQLLKKIVDTYLLSYKYPYDTLGFASWPAKSKILNWLFTTKVRCPRLRELRKQTASGTLPRANLLREFTKDAMDYIAA